MPIHSVTIYLLPLMFSLQEVYATVQRSQPYCTTSTHSHSGKVTIVMSSSLQFCSLCPKNLSIFITTLTELPRHPCGTRRFWRRCRSTVNPALRQKQNSSSPPLLVFRETVLGLRVPEPTFPYSTMDLCHLTIILTASLPSYFDSPRRLRRFWIYKPAASPLKLSKYCAPPTVYLLLRKNASLPDQCLAYSVSTSPSWKSAATPLVVQERLHTTATSQIYSFFTAPRWTRYRTLEHSLRLQLRSATCRQFCLYGHTELAQWNIYKYRRWMTS